LQSAVFLGAIKGWQGIKPVYVYEAFGLPSTWHGLLATAVWARTGEYGILTFETYRNVYYKIPCD